AKKEDAVQDAKNEAEIAEAEAKADEAERVAKQKGRVCKYCGNSVPDGADACPACGSRNFE
ncbi:MAG: zinc-ribbon domain-containing protein, partial [Clostridia bacterium]|nr:zinc-ribbon domain-containing protein [Clostridia bacterium]